jgi:ATP-binding cassette, subfamily B, bacterial
MKTWRLLWRVILYRPWFFILDALLVTLFYFSRVAFGAIMQDFFNLLPTQPHLSFAIWALLILLVLTAIVRVAVILSEALADILCRFMQRTLLSRNLLEYILQRPGAQALPFAPGETLNILRDDAQNVEVMLMHLLNAIGLALFSIVAFIQLLLVDKLLTLVVFVPLAIVIAVTQSLSARIQRYRVASREATGRVIGAIGEIFGAVQAIQVAGAEPYVVEHFRALNTRRRVGMVRDRALPLLPGLRDHFHAVVRRAHRPV